MAATAGCCMLVVFLLLYLADQLTDALTMVLYFAEGLRVAGMATGMVTLLPALVLFCLELRSFAQGEGHFIRALAVLISYPLYTCLILLYSIFNAEWRGHAVLLVMMQGLLTSGPQLVLQLSLWLQGLLTTPAWAVLESLHTGLNTTRTAPPSEQQLDDDDFELFGRSYDGVSQYWLGVAQLVSLAVSFLTHFAVVLYFNWADCGGTGKSVLRLLFGGPFFLLTIIYRAVTLALVICFLHWWSSLVMFLLFFMTVMTSIWAGDMFPRACAYGIWCLLAPVGFARDPMDSLGYRVYRKYDIAEIDPFDEKRLEATCRQRARYFVPCHLAISTGLLLPSLIAAVVLANITAGSDDSWWTAVIVSSSILPTAWLTQAVLPGLGLALGLSLLSGGCYVAAL